VTTLDTTIQRRQLPLLGPYVEPRSPTELALSEIWRRAFDMDCVGITDSYLDLGGDSFLAASIFAECEATFGITLPLALMEESGTIKQMAENIDGMQKGAR
jgi:hypothetical protein